MTSNCMSLPCASARSRRRNPGPHQLSALADEPRSTRPPAAEAPGAAEDAHQLVVHMAPISEPPERPTIPEAKNDKAEVGHLLISAPTGW